MSLTRVSEESNTRYSPLPWLPGLGENMAMRKSHAPDEPASAKRARLNEKTRRFQKAFGAVLRNLREARKITQADLGEVAGRDQTSMSNHESGVNFPRLQAIIEIADRYGMPIWELFRQAEERLQAPQVWRPPLWKPLREAGKTRTTRLPHDAGKSAPTPTRKKGL